MLSPLRRVAAISTLLFAAIVSRQAAPVVHARTGASPLASHPRLWVTAADLPRLRSWAVPSNPTYTKGLVPVLNKALSVYNSSFAPFYTSNPPSTSYPDPGDTQGYSGDLTEEYGVVLAFNSLIAPNTDDRATYAQDARNMLMYAMDRAALGHKPNVPFRDPAFAIYNRANGSGEEWPLIVDWIYPVLARQDKHTIRTVFMMWANDCLHAETTGGDHPSPIGAENKHSLLPGGKPYRMAANNYYLGHARLLTMMALSLDPTDDPPLNPHKPVMALGNSLRSYLRDATGSWLYQEYAMFGQPGQVSKNLKLKSATGLGLADGGLPSEGMLYGHSLGFALGQLLALQTAGHGTAFKSDPQAALITSPVWHRMIDGFISSLVPSARVVPGFTYLGPVYQMASYGDLLRLWMTPDFMQQFALLTQLERHTGQVDSHGVPIDDNAARWFVTDALQGGSAALYDRMTSPWSNIEPILYFLMLDPSESAPTDPRPSLPTTFIDKNAGRAISRTGWGPNATMFDYRGSWESINHQDADGGQFEFYRNGEWLTKEMSNYDSNGYGQTSEFHNTMSIENKSPDGTPSNLQWYQGPMWSTGSQWNLADNGGDPKTLISSGPGYVSAVSNLTKLYNRPDFWSPKDAANQVAGASRSIVWLNGDYVVIFDRVNTKSKGLFRRENFELVTSPSLNGHEATEVTPAGQQLFIQSLLPNDAALAATNPTSEVSFMAWMEPTQYRLTVSDPAKPKSTHFLTVLQGADKNASMVPATVVHSLSGNAFTGAAFAKTIVYFVNDLRQRFTGVTIAAPASGSTVYITGLPRDSRIGLMSSGLTLTLRPGSGLRSDSSGVVEIRS